MATFSEPIALTGLGAITVSEVGGDSSSDFTIDLTSLPDADAGVSVSGAVLTIDPTVNLEFVQDYEVTISNDAIVDLADTPNAYLGTASGDWTFTTIAVDALAPVATVYDPADNAVDVVPNANLVITFDEDVVLNYSVTTLLDEDFESDNGNFALSGAPNDWARGTPNADNDWDLVLTTGNNGSARCWGTVLGAGGTAPYGTITAGSDSILQGPDAGGNGIDLTGVVSAQLQFAAAVDAKTGDTVEVLVREVTTNDLLVTVPAITAPMDADWATYGPFDVSDAAGKNVYLEFRFVGADATYIGLYVDDVNVTGVSPGNNIVLKNLTDSIDTVIPVSDSSRVSVNGAEVTISPAFSCGCRELRRSDRRDRDPQLQRSRLCRYRG
ncbi:hypothetical protein BSZ32_03140 [Rubritalea profundi]|uniref:SbsA Ig-like domain-containing protein n=1 Tax=Rubritalea profundi TaxID=1658618 RepID=A0A2S7TXV1_9BACT|nr:hypothetical protein BSZ32_03140 [Rubritalea profundi]